MNDEALLHAIIQNAIDGIITINSCGVIELANPSVCKLFGYMHTELIGQSVNMLMCETDGIQHQQYINNYQHTGMPRIIGIGREVNGRRKDGTNFPFRLAVSKIVNEERILYTGIIHDLSKEKLVERNAKKHAEELELQVASRTRQLEETIVELEKTQQELNISLVKEKEINQMKSRFVSMASHEFRSPLSCIQLSASLIERYYDRLDRQKVTLHLNKIKNAVSDLTANLNDFLSVERIESGKVAPILTVFNIQEFSANLTEEMQLVARDGQRILYRHLGYSAEITLDKNLLKHCLVNLLSNAIKYSDEVGSIQFETEVKDQECYIRVADHGIGIPEKSLGHLFEAFYRSDNTGDVQGTGLGLSIVEKYTQLMNGRIRVKSEVNRGSTFTLVFPVK